MTTPDFYRAFEERYRGSRSLIQQRLQVYLPYVQPLLSLDQAAPAPVAIDLGCGRGEWLELLQRTGFAPQGVDLDTGMLAACHELGLPAVQGDALAHLRTLGDGTQAIVSGFHIAEHIGFEDLQTLIGEALRVLQPGGLLILETPNPENLTVGSCSFYLDPTHQRPLPPKLLSFLPEHLGYARVKVLRLQEESRLLDSASIQLIDVLAGVSPDYAVVAQKPASPEVLQAFDAAFALVHGLELETLAQRFDSRVPLPQMQEEIIARINAHIDARLVPLVEQITCTDQRALAAEAQRDALLQSLSWRMTAGLRSTVDWYSRVNLLAAPSQAKAQIAQAIQTAQIGKKIHQLTLVPLMHAVLQRPRLSYRVNQVLRRLPWLHRRLVSVARQGGVVVNLQAYGTDDMHSAPLSSDLAALTPEARKIYRQFKAATCSAPQLSREHH